MSTLFVSPWVATWRIRLLTGLYWLALAVGTHWPGLDLLPGDLDLGVWQIDKVLHVAAFAGLTWLLILARPLGTGKAQRFAVPVAALLAAMYAIVDEWTQQWFGRSVAASDLLASGIGVLGVYLIAATGSGTPVSLWRAYLIRGIWLVIAPSLVLAATLPASNRAIGWLISYFTRPAAGLDKWAHFWIALVLTWLLASAAPAGRARPRLGVFFTIFIMGLSAPLIETIQRHTGRGYEIADAYYHQLGLLTALVGWSFFTALKPLPFLGFLHRHAAPTQDDSQQAHFASHALLVGALTLLSRLTGLLRDAVLAAIFGLTSVADAFLIGFIVPNLFRRLFGEGALSAAFIPHYAKLLKTNPLIAKRFATITLCLLLIVLAGLTIVGELVLASLATGQWSEKTALAINFTMIMLPYMPLVCVVALIGGILQVHSKFGPPAAAPILLNLTMIGFAVAGAFVFYRSQALDKMATLVAVGVLVGGGLQLLWQIVALLQCTPLTNYFAGTRTHLRSMLIMMGPMVVGLAVFQINTLMDSLIAFGFSPAQENAADQLRLWGYQVAYPIEVGAVSALQWAQRLYQFPLGVFGVAIATAIFPALARAASEDDNQAGDRFATLLRQGLRLTVFLGLPASVGLILISRPLTRIIFEHGRFNDADTLRVTTILVGYATAVWAYSMTHVLTRAFYARRDSMTPLKVSVAMVALNLGLNLTLIWWWHAAGLAWSTAICAVGQVLLLLVLVRKHVRNPLDAEVWGSWARTAILTVAMAAALGPAMLYCNQVYWSMWETAGLIALAAAFGAAVVLGGSYLSGAAELQWLMKRRQN